MEIFDAHTHFFSRSFFETLAKQSPREGKVEDKLSAVHAETGIEIPGGDDAAHTQRWLRALDEAKVERAISFASAPEEVGAVAEGVAASGGRLVGYTVVDPRPATAVDFVQRALGELGHRGLVLFPAMHGYRVSDPAVRPVLEAARDHGAVIVVHCGLLHVALRDRFGLPKAYSPRASDPLELVPVAQSMQELRFVVPHFGGGFLTETLMACSMADNVLVDTSSSNSWLRLHGGITLRDVFRRFLDVVGPERVLYGSDSSIFPRGYRTDLLATQRALLDELAPDAAAQAAVLGGNLRRLLGGD